MGTLLNLASHADILRGLSRVLVGGYPLLGITDIKFRWSAK